MKTLFYSFFMLSLLTGCSDPKVANDKNIITALSQYLEGTGGAICLNLHQWPLDLAPDDLRMLQRFPQGIAAQMVILEHAGLVKSQDIKLDGLDLFGHPSVGKRYELTDKGKAFYQAKTVDQFGQSYAGDLCVAHKKLEKLVEWQINKDNEDQTVNAKYNYTVINIADWAKSAEFKVGFPDVNISSTSQSEKRTLSLMDKGWWIKADVATNPSN
jgi:hypothetical protein